MPSTARRKSALERPRHRPQQQPSDVLHARRPRGAGYGGGRGIGRAIVERLQGEGASVVIADSGTAIDGSGSDPAIARDVAAGFGARAAAFTQSLASPSAAAAAVDFAVQRFGGIDIVVNNAAIIRDGFIFQAEPLDWDAVIGNNLSRPFHVLAAATPVLRAQAKALRGGTPYGWGRIVNGNYGQAAYASAKAGLLGLTRGRGARHAPQPCHLRRRGAVCRDAGHGIDQARQ
jgi:NAD(P)-dependent dehydrogenase (short-subunit alcohol dehydrogenase family)